MYTFYGQYEVKMDTKGRLKLPVDLLRQIPEETRKTYVLNKGLDKCLRLYPNSQWKQITQQLSSQLNYFQNKEREFLRFFYQDVTNIELDSSDRILIPKRLQEKFGIKEEIVIIAFHDAIEIWDSNTYYNNIKEPENFADLADEIFSKINDRNSK